MNGKSLSPKAVINRKKKLELSRVSSHNQITPLKLVDSTAALLSPYSIVSNVSRLNLRLNPGSSKKRSCESAKNKIKEQAKQFTAASKAACFMRKSIGDKLLPMPSHKAVSAFSGVLNRLELSEMSEYENIYYAGLRATKVTPSPSLKNFGFDDENCDYIVNIADHLAYQYEILEILGSGTFAQVVKCWDHKTHREVAVKIIKNQPQFSAQGQIELRVLLTLRELTRNHFVTILSHFQFRMHLCIVLEVLSFSLFDLLKANNSKGLSSGLVRRFTQQTLEALSSLKKQEIIHCDLKPENIALVTPHESAIKLIDFGSACFLREKNYHYIQSRAYRAPEVIFGVTYSTSIDMWSLGCIVAELITGTALFTGENEEDQLNAIIETIGEPPIGLIEDGLKATKFFRSKLKSAATPTAKVRMPGSRRLEKIIPGDASLVDFIKRKAYVGCLDWDPSKRISPEQALKHPWVADSGKSVLCKSKKRLSKKK